MILEKQVLSPTAKQKIDLNLDRNGALKLLPDNKKRLNKN